MAIDRRNFAASGGYPWFMGADAVSILVLNGHVELVAVYFKISLDLRTVQWFVSAARSVVFGCFARTVLHLNLSFY